MTDTIKHMWDQVAKAQADGTFSSPQASPDQQCLSDMTLANNARKAAIEECARELENQPPSAAPSFCFGTSSLATCPCATSLRRPISKA